MGRLPLPVPDPARAATQCANSLECLASASSHAGGGPMVSVMRESRSYSEAPVGAGGEAWGEGWLERLQLRFRGLT